MLKFILTACVVITLSVAVISYGLIDGWKRGLLTDSPVSRSKLRNGPSCVKGPSYAAAPSNGTKLEDLGFIARYNRYERYVAVRVTPSST